MKIIAFDIDGTSVNQYKFPTKKTIKTLKCLHEAGFILVPTTGRCLDELPRKFLKLNIFDYVITSNGARVIEMKDQSVIYEHTIPNDKLLSLLKAIDFKKWMVSFHVENKVYDNTNIMRFARRVIFHKDFRVTTRVRNVQKFIESHKHQIEKLQFVTFKKGNLNQFIYDIENVDSFEFPVSRRNYVEITDRHVDKMTGLKALCEILKVDMNEVIAIGDDMNDILMLKSVGLAIAMGNAKEIVKMNADYVTKSNREEGFYYAFKHYFPENINF